MFFGVHVIYSIFLCNAISKTWSSEAEVQPRSPKILSRFHKQPAFLNEDIELANSRENRRPNSRKSSLTDSEKSSKIAQQLKKMRERGGVILPKPSDVVKNLETKSKEFTQQMKAKEQQKGGEDKDKSKKPALMNGVVMAYEDQVMNYKINRRVSSDFRSLSARKLGKMSADPFLCAPREGKP